MADRSAERVGDESVWFRRPDGADASQMPVPWRPGLPPANDEPGYQRSPRTAFWPRLGKRVGLGFRAFQAALVLEAERGTAFQLVPVFLAIGALAYFALPFEPGFGLLGVAAAAILALRFAVRRRPIGRAAATCLILVLAGGAAGKIETWRAGTKMLGGEIASRVTGRVVEVETTARGGGRVTIDVTATERPKLKYAPDRVRLTARKLPQGLAAGDTISGLARLAPPPGPTRPGSYDFSFSSYFQGIGATGFFLADPKMIAAADDPSAGFARTIREAVADAREKIAGHIRAHIGGPEGEIAAALAVGVDGGIPEDVSEALRRSGLYHIISISGLHMALVAGMVLAAMRIGCACFPGFSSRHPVRKVAALTALMAITGYLVISGAEVAAQRSYLMLAVMLAAVLVDRAALTMRNLAISAILVIALSPHEVVGPSFQMSFAATAALVGAYALWNDLRNRRPGAPPLKRSPLRSVLRRGWRMAYGLAITSLVAGLATAVFGAYHFQRVSPLSLFSNLATAPIVSGIVVPAGLLAALAAPFGLDGPFLDAMGAGLRAMIAVARWFSERSPVDAVGLVSGVSVVLITMALVIATAATTWLRVLAVPLALAGVATLGLAQTPDVLVSEDGKTVGVPIASGALALDRPRGGGFTVNDWSRAMQASRILRTRQTLLGETMPPIDFAGYYGEGFACDERGCAARQRDGALVVHLSDGEEALRACGYADVIVVFDPLGPRRCADRRVAVISARDLALHGSAAVHLPKNSPDDPIRVEFAVPEDNRPWQAHRVFSRAARGLPNYRRPKTDHDGKTAPTTWPMTITRAVIDHE